jgi:metal-sulfur cluster biosynthetic enzyme
MMPELESEVWSRLGRIIDPCSVGSGNEMSIVDMGLVDSVELHEGDLRICLCLTSPQCLMLEHFATEARGLLADLPEVLAVTVRGDNGTNWHESRLSSVARARRNQHLSRLLPLAFA